MADTYQKARPQAAKFFSLECEATVRMCVPAADREEAAEIVATLLGSGEWIADGKIGVPFGVKVKLAC